MEWVNIRGCRLKVRVLVFGYLSSDPSFVLTSFVTLGKLLNCVPIFQTKTGI